MTVNEDVNINGIISLNNVTVIAEDIDIAKQKNGLGDDVVALTIDEGAILCGDVTALGKVHLKDGFIDGKLIGNSQIVPQKNMTSIESLLIEAQNHLQTVKGYNMQSTTVSSGTQFVSIQTYNDLKTVVNELKAINDATNDIVVTNKILEFDIIYTKFKDELKIGTRMISADPAYSLSGMNTINNHVDGILINIIESDATTVAEVRTEHNNGASSVTLNTNELRDVIDNSLVTNISPKIVITPEANILTNTVELTLSPYELTSLANTLKGMLVIDAGKLGLIEISADTLDKIINQANGAYITFEIGQSEGESVVVETHKGTIMGIENEITIIRE